MKKFLVPFLVIAMALFAGTALADSIDPAEFSATLEVGESVTITKTVTIDDAPPTSGVLDVMFMFDTSGSMSYALEQAKSAADDILTGLSSFGDLASGVGYYDEPGPGDGYPPAIIQDLSTSAATTAATINTDVYLSMGGGGGDFPEEGIRSLTEIAEDTSWRSGSTRFIIALGDATFKESDGFTLEGASEALEDSGAVFIGIDYGYMTRSDYGGIDPTIFANDSDGSIIPSSGLDPADLVADIIAAVEASFEDYTAVTIGSDGADGISVTVDALGVAGDTFYGDYDRSVERTFTFEVTFEALAEGTFAFDTFALVDGGAVAVEADRFEVGPGGSVPEPATMFLLGTGLLGLAGLRRKLR